MEALLTSTLSVAIAEIGDKTQLLALLLICRFRKPWPIIAGMLAATVLNHACAAWLGEMISRWLDPKLLTYLVAGAFIAMAIWILVPDKMDDEESPLDRFGPFVATFILFFIAEIGDKTQIATVLLAAKYDAFFQVIAGTTLGMMLANVPVVLLGKLGADRLPMRLIRASCALLFTLLGVSTLLLS
ncbi:TMEM165/GDT1 family protein [Aeromonas simiae]|uniref:TMEM165/GDT1 family protein n=1 Tax=Aeromonas simiae TaxID=218936 RepID=UPI0005AAE587|nr:TMEM165/GDT1 family protein [Aeromonas simiae]MDO2947797.1 TMEM165/GDT1 family protein [Aeromonas simiae]MDO2952636.1 TMEM165/GDT1 family protein [Aeromonas simiae]MDO2955012.1 TMEM165/GDT1 family protein [Aeromonas simiae]